MSEARVTYWRDKAKRFHSDVERLRAENERLLAALDAVRFNLLQAGYAENSIMIEGIDAALSQKESTP